MKQYLDPDTQLPLPLVDSRLFESIQRGWRADLRKDDDGSALPECKGSPWYVTIDYTWDLPQVPDSSLSLCRSRKGLIVCPKH